MRRRKTRVISPQTGQDFGRVRVPSRWAHGPPDLGSTVGQFGVERVLIKAVLDAEVSGQPVHALKGIR